MTNSRRVMPLDSYIQNHGLSESYQLCCENKNVFSGNTIWRIHLSQFIIQSSKHQSDFDSSNPIELQSFHFLAASHWYNREGKFWTTSQERSCAMLAREREREITRTNFDCYSRVLHVYYLHIDWKIMAATFLFFISCVSVTQFGCFAECIWSWLMPREMRFTNICRDPLPSPCPRCSEIIIEMTLYTSIAIDDRFALGSTRAKRMQIDIYLVSTHFPFVAEPVPHTDVCEYRLDVFRKLNWMGTRERWRWINSWKCINFNYTYENWEKKKRNVTRRTGTEIWKSTIDMRCE